MRFASPSFFLVLDFSRFHPAPCSHGGGVTSSLHELNPIGIDPNEGLADGVGC